MRWPFRRAHGLPKIESVRRIQVGPDDVIILTVPGCISQQQAQEIRERVSVVLKTDRIMVLVDGIQVDVAELPAQVAR